jgi:hypothetical protein
MYSSLKIFNVLNSYFPDDTSTNNYTLDIIGHKRTPTNAVGVLFLFIIG